MKRSRHIAVMTYCSEEQIQEVLVKHKNSIKGFAYIYHDKDDSEPHRHLYLNLYNAWTCNNIQLWFIGYDCNTMVELVGDVETFLLYLTHSDLKSIKEEKHRYNQSEIVSAGVKFDDPQLARDDTFEILSQLRAGVSLMYLVKVYGRDFVYHYGAYRDLLQDVQQQESSFRFASRPVEPHEPKWKEVNTESEQLEF